MRQPFSDRSRSALMTLALVTGMAVPALAGPPLLCFPFDIGTAESLPWDGASGWKGMRTDYDTSRLTADTTALLTPSTPILVRMETLRRAALYATRDEHAARALLAAVKARASAPRGSASPDPRVLFDAGYLVETYKQTAHFAPATAALVRGDDGYALIRESLSRTNDDPAIAFAAALMTEEHGKAARSEHARRARAGVQADALLARNIDHLQR